MLKIFLSSTFRELSETRAKILDELDTVFEGVGMEKFIPDGKTPHEICIAELKKSDIVIFILSSDYGSPIDDCKLKESCKAECPMKTGDSHISYTHCEYKTAISERKLRQTYKVLKGWDTQDKEEASQFEIEFGKEFWDPIRDIDDPNVVPKICNNLATKIVEWHTEDKLNFKQFCDREVPFNELINYIDGKVEVHGVGGIGKTALIQVALLIQKLKGKKIISIGIPKAYASGSGFEFFRLKCKDDQYITDSQDEITIYDVINALVKTKLIFNQEDILKKPKDELVELLSKQIRKEKNLTVFIDDFHLANKDVVNFVKTLDNIVLSSRKITYVAKKELCILGIDEEDREDLINLYTTSELPIKAKELIKQIAEGHPISTELLVKNYQKINFDNLTNFDLENANDEQVKEFYQRVIEEIFSTNPQALALLKDLAVLNTDLENNIDREIALQSYEIDDPVNSFNELLDTGMLKKKEDKEGTYEFCYIHIQDALEDISDRKSHDKAIKYYEKKKEILGEDIDDDVEVLYHKVKTNPNDILVDEFLEIKDKAQPVHYAFKRLIKVGEDLKVLVKEKNKAHILGTLGTLFNVLGKFEEAETAYQEALEIYKELAEKNPEAYKLDVAVTQNNLGNLYSNLGWFEEAETAYQEALEITIELAEKNPNAYKPGVATTQNNLGNLYSDLGRFEEAETTYQDAFRIYKELVDKNPDAYKPDVAGTQNNLGTLYLKLGWFGEAETAYQEALEIFKELVDKNPDAYKPYVVVTQNNLGTLYLKLGRLAEAKTAYQEALEISKQLAEKNPDAYKPYVTRTQNSLGRLYSELGKFEEAETAYQEALEIYKELAEKNPDAYKPDVAGTQNNLGTLYLKLGRFEEAEIAYQEALEIINELAEKNPDAYKQNIAMTQNSLGILYRKLGRLAEAETAYQEALEISKQLAEKNPDAYKQNIARTQNSLGILYQKLGRFEEAEIAYQEALEIINELAEKNPDAYKQNIAMTQNNLGTLYRKLGRFEEAETAYIESLEIRVELAKKSPKAYKLDVATAQNNLGTLYSDIGRFEEAEKAYQEALEIDPRDSNLWYNKACLESLRNVREKAIEYLKRAIELDKKYFEMAKSDEDFDNIRTSKEFKELIGE